MGIAAIDPPDTIEAMNAPSKQGGWLVKAKGGW
jgi:hypothetical protein